MSFGRQDQDDEIIRLLGKLGDTGPEYPSSMFSQRRAAVMAAFAALNLGAAVVGLTLLGHLAKILKGMGLLEKIILGVEVAAVTGMTAYGAATAYVYRDQLRQILESNLGITTNTPFPSLSAPIGGAAATQLSETGTPTPTGSPTPTGTWFTEMPTQGGGNPQVTPPPQATQPQPTQDGNCSPNQQDQGKCVGHNKTPKPTQGGGKP